MEQLNKEDILRYFEEINQNLLEMGKHVEIIITGGAELTPAKYKSKFK